MGTSLNPQTFGAMQGRWWGPRGTYHQGGTAGSPTADGRRAEAPTARTGPAQMDRELLTTTERLVRTGRVQYAWSMSTAPTDFIISS